METTVTPASGRHHPPGLPGFPPQWPWGTCSQFQLCPEGLWQLSPCPPTASPGVKRTLSQETPKPERAAASGTGRGDVPRLGGTRADPWPLAQPTAFPGPLPAG